MPQIATALDEDMACDLTSYLRSMGVTVYTGMSISDLEGLDSDLVILSAGVRPESELAAAAGLKLSRKGAILVDGRMRTSDEHIYAVGDAIRSAISYRGMRDMSPWRDPLTSRAESQRTISQALPANIRVRRAPPS